MTTTSPLPPDLELVPASKDASVHTATFFDALLETAPEDTHGLLWTLQDKRSAWVALEHGAAPIAVRARELADTGKDVYVAVSVAEQPGLPDTRIKSANAAGIFGLWADIDVADPDVHKKWNLPPSIEAAIDLLDAAGVAPTMVVHSGHGLQAWWLFKEFWSFDTEEARLEAAGLAQRWNTTLQVRAAERSWVVDSTFDLARVMRVPGTLNRKGSPVMPVRLLSLGGPRYEAEDIEAFCVDPSVLASRGVSSARSYQPDPIEVNDANKVDFEKLQAACDNNDQFKSTWDMARKDFADQSPSSYDMSLATLAAQMAWTDQEIANLILAFRRRHKLDVSKALRPDYITRTLRRARDGISREASVEAIDEVGEALDDAKASGDDEAIKTSRRDALDVISARCGVEFLHFIKYLSDPPAYAAVTPTVTIPVGGTDGFLQWHKFRQAVAGYANELLPRMKPSEWDDVCHLILKTVEEQDVGAEATERGEIAAWLAAYLNQRPPTDSLEEASGSEYPYKDDEGRVMLFGPAFRRWLYLTYQERMSNTVLGRRLRAFGCEPDKVNVTEATGKRTTRGVWRLPEGVDRG